MTPRAVLLAAVVLAVAAPAQTRFLVAGHAYGSHHGDNPALDPSFTAALDRADLDGVAFLMLAGDFVRRCEAEPVAALERELDALPFETWLVRGNHEANELGAKLLQRRHGGTYYRFDHDGARFVVLDTQREPRSVDAEQLAFLQAALAETTPQQPVFVLLHELIWLSRGERYRDVRANRRSRQARSYASNYWDAVHPLLAARAPQPVTVIAGDLGGNPDAVPAFHERRGNVTFMACGLGEIPDGCYLDLRFDGGALNARLVTLDPARTLPPLEQLTPAALAQWPLPPAPFRLRRWLLAGAGGLLAGAAACWLRFRRRAPRVEPS